MTVSATSRRVSSCAREQLVLSPQGTALTRLDLRVSNIRSDHGHRTPRRTDLQRGIGISSKIGSREASAFRDSSSTTRPYPHLPPRPRLTRVACGHPAKSASVRLAVDADESLARVSRVVQDLAEEVREVFPRPVRMRTIRGSTQTEAQDGEARHSWSAA